MDRTDLIQRIVRHADSSGAPDTPTLTEIPGLAFVRCRRPTSIAPTHYPALVAVVLQGSKETLLGDETIAYRVGQSLIVSLELPAVSRVTEATPERPYVALSLEIDPVVLAELRTELDRAPTASSRVVEAGRADDHLVDAFGRLFDLLGDPARRKVLAPLLAREIHAHTLFAGHAGMLRRIAREDGSASRIARAIQHIRTRFPTMVAVDELARVAGMSASTFHEHFRATTTTTPRQYQKDLRLLHARQRLASGRDSVSTVAFEVGYASPNHFSRDYARRFGHPPRVEVAARS